MGFRFRKKINVLPGVSINLSKSGVSTTLKIGSATWNSRTDKISVNLPGPLSYQFNNITELTKAELVEIAKQNGLKGYSKLNKRELIEFLKQNKVIEKVMY